MVDVTEEKIEATRDYGLQAINLTSNKFWAIIFFLHVSDLQIKQIE